MDDNIFLEKMHCSAVSAPTSYAAVSRALSMESQCALRSIVLTASGDIALGVPAGRAFANAIRASHLKNGRKGGLIGAVSGCGDARAAMLAIYGEVMDADRLRMELGFGAVQKYMTLALLSGVILPSLALFGFIGYSMLYNSAEGFILFSGMLVFAFPMAYALLRRKMGEVYG